MPSAELLRRHRHVVEAIKAETLDGTDNYLVETAWLTHVSSRWAEFVNFYASAVCLCIQDDFNRNSCAQNPFEPPIMRLQSPHDTVPSFGYVEQHIELKVVTAYSAYRLIEERVSEAAPNISVSMLQLFGRDGSARWHECRLTEQIKLKIYAKSIERIRLEIEYHGPSAGGHRSVGQLVQDPLWAGARSFIEKIQALQRDAVDRLQLVIDHLARPTDDRMPSLDLFRHLIVYLCRSKFSGRDVEAFLGELFEFGHVGGSENSPARRIAEALRRRNLLEPVSIGQQNSDRRYRPIIGLRGTIQALQAVHAVQAASAT